MTRFAQARCALPAILMAGIAALSASPSHADDAWTQNGRDAGASSYNADQTILGAGNLVQLGTLWTQPPSSNVVESQGQLFLNRLYRDNQGNYHKVVMSLNPQSGATLWEAGTNVDSYDPPALTDRLVISPSFSEGSTRSSMNAYDRAAGQLAWHYEHGYNPFSEPHVLDGAVYFVDASDQAVISLDAATGAQRWLVELSGARTAALVGNGVVVVGLISGLVAFDAQDGHTLWTVDLAPAVNSDRPMIVGDTVLVYNERGKVYAYDLATGALLWKSPALPLHTKSNNGSMATDGRRVFVLHGQRPTKMTALDLATGARVWSQTVTNYPFDPIVSNGVIYVITPDAIQALDTATGRSVPIASLPGGDYQSSGLAIAEGRLFLSAPEGLNAFGLGASQATLR